jgi:protein translocase SecG subunit
MTTLLNAILIITGLIFSICIMLMSPKGGLGFSIGGMSSNNEYGSKKSLEHTIKKVAYVTGIIFVVTALLYPYLNG